jgi:hypothetical protein
MKGLDEMESIEQLKAELKSVRLKLSHSLRREEALREQIFPKTRRISELEALNKKQLQLIIHLTNELEWREINSPQSS